MSERTDHCPICKTAVSRKNGFFPFCSSRCKTVDLGAWSAEEYVISRPVTEADEHYESVADQAHEDKPYE